MTDLRQLSISLINQFSIGDALTLNKLVALSDLRLSTHAEELPSLFFLEHVRRLEIDAPRIEFTNLLCVPLNSLHFQTEARITDNRILDVDMSLMKDLMQLALGICSFSDAGLVHLLDLPRLQTLELTFRFEFRVFAFDTIQAAAGKLDLCLIMFD